ncbi:MAG TPA: glycosyltransferase family 87 protein [Sediminibacterium sp.]|nr:glycosyltransferase family 87 protein [Sediminibacterium sp.]
MKQFQGKKDWLFSNQLAMALWFGLPLIGVILEFARTSGNNYLIYTGVYHHLLKHSNLYAEYPAEYADVNLYGPVFGLVIAPFALLPNWLGVTLWELFNAALLFFAIRSLPIQRKWQNFILIFCSVEMMNTAQWMQSNALIAACILFGFSGIHRGRDGKAVFWILLAAFIKLYGIAGFSFFFFSKKKWQFVYYSLLWSVLFFTAPMLLGGASFVVQSYSDWLHRLQLKDIRNTRLDIQNDFQDISVMGMLRRIFHFTHLKNYWVTLPAIFLFATQYLRWRDFRNTGFRLYLLCSVLLTIIIFTTSSESPTYIIAFPGICIWFVLQPPGRNVRLLFAACLILTSFSYSDIFTPYVRDHLVRPYSIKALPSFVIWVVLLLQIWTRQYKRIPDGVLTDLSLPAHA